MNDYEKSKLISRRDFLGSTAAAGLVLAAPLALNSLAAEDNRPNRLRYDISQFKSTDPRLIKYEEESRVAKTGVRARRVHALPDGGFLIACESGVIEFSSSGAKVRQFATPSAARCVARAGDGLVYAATPEHLYVYDQKGVQQSAWKVPDSKTWFTGLAVGENDLFAADSANRVILRYDRSGKVIGRIGEKNKDHNIPGIILPSPYLHVALGRDGLLRVNNTGRHKIELYTTEGDLELSWGKSGAGIETFCGCCNPVGIAVLPDGRCVTAEKGLPRVKVYSADGNFESVVAGPESFEENSRHGAARDAKDGTMGGLDVAVTPAGRILILDLVTGDVHVMKEKRA